MASHPQPTYWSAEILNPRSTILRATAGPRSRLFQGPFPSTHALIFLRFRLKVMLDGPHAGVAEAFSDTHTIALISDRISDVVCKPRPTGIPREELQDVLQLFSSQPQCQPCTSNTDLQ